jgi:hypothetical protein
LKRASSETPGVGGAGKATTQASIVILGIQMILEGSSLFKHFTFNRMVHNYRYDLLIMSRILSSFVICLLHHSDSVAP